MCAISCDRDRHDIAKTTREHRRLVRVYRRNVLSAYRVVRGWIGLMREAILYGLETQLIQGREPILEALEEYDSWKPSTPLEKALLELRADEYAKRLSDGYIEKGPFDRIVTRIADWHCIRNRGDRRLARMHMRIYGEAAGIAGQLARFDVSWDVVNRKAVEWAAKNSARLVTLITDETRAAIRDVISRGINRGMSIPSIARELRAIDAIGLNRPQMSALMKFRDRIMDRYAAMRGGMTPTRRAKALKTIRREAQKKLRYRTEMIARTETARAVSAGTREIYDEAGVERVRFDASADACLVCAWYDGNIYRRGEMEGLIPVHPNCLIDAQVKVYTADGWKAIKNIEIGDLVLTHKGRFRKVTYLHRVPKQKPNVVNFAIKTGHKRRYSLSLTEDHPIIVNGKWKYAKDVRVGDVVGCLANSCKECGKPVPVGDSYCGVSCGHRHGAKELWKRPGHREIISKKIRKSMLEQYDSGIRDRFKTTLAANGQMRQAIEVGAWHWLGPHPEWSGENNPAKRPEVREKIRQSKLGNKNPMKKYPHLAKEHSRRMKQFYKDYPEKHLNAILAQKSRMKQGGKTYIEEIMGDALARYSIDARYNYCVGNLWIDYAIVSQKIAIECDGERWHQDKEKEAKRDKRLEENGWTVLHFTGSEIEADIDECIAKVSRVMMNHDGEYRFADFEVVRVDSFVPKKAKMLYNLSVEEDESYVAKGFVVANCRCTWTPVVGPTLAERTTKIEE